MCLQISLPFAGVLAGDSGLGMVGGGGVTMHFQVLKTPTKITLRGVYGHFPEYTANAAPEKTCLLRISNLPESAEDSADTPKSKSKIRSHNQPFHSVTQMMWECIFLEVSLVAIYSDHCLCLLSKYFIRISQSKFPRGNLNNSYPNITVN